MTILLKPFELLWRAVNRLRRALYRRGILKGKRLPRPVISVGNLAAGGAGKTPAVVTIARYLEKRGFRVAVLTRGYGRAGNVSGLVTSLDAAKFGDEPVLLKSKLKNIDVIVGSKRYQNAVQYLNSNECDLFILDDGFQHLKLARDTDVVIDSGRGVMREGRSALADADFVIQRRLRLVVPEELTGRRVFAFAGLAYNEQFFASLRENGLDMIGTRSFRDHHRYTAGDIDAIKEAARTAGAEAIVTTEKDAVKIDDRDIIAIAAEMMIEPEILARISGLVD
ncbi:MAG: tetraacyldisaccharide 4'-kinase [Acidobacteria bacterium]|nr:tetraacyldisaccharide 4'-kinase [Acidobacteriota bacterium]MBV9187216.1 tetraacyldisaccharide 4'-kinase [Acidobacteriota bacterium]